uniref:Uncharacterized protein n=1 Tax=Octopus bimaculoides TaxID=37653 RepID=A0A0L8GEB2_OCTBM
MQQSSLHLCVGTFGGKHHSVYPINNQICPQHHLQQIHHRHQGKSRNTHCLECMLSGTCTWCPFPSCGPSLSHGYQSPGQWEVMLVDFQCYNF